MKTLLLAAAAAMISTAAGACTLSTKDFAALQESPVKVTKAEFTAMPPDQQKPICETRDFLKLVQKGPITRIGSYSTDYLSPDENDKVIDASTDYFNRLMASKGFGTA